MRRLGAGYAGAGFHPSLSLKTGIHGVAGGADWWDPDGDGLCVWGAWQAKGADNLAASYLDLSGNGNNLSLGVAPTWDAVNGWQFNGTTQWLETSALLSQDWSFLCQFASAVAGKRIMGNLVFNQRAVIQPNNFANRTFQWRGGTVSVAGGVASGNAGIAGGQSYYNGLPEGAPIAGLFLQTFTMNMGRGNAAAPVYGSSHIYAVAFYNCTLTAPQVASVAAAMAAL